MRGSVPCVGTWDSTSVDVIPIDAVSREEIAQWTDLLCTRRSRAVLSLKHREILACDYLQT
jgi:hypothetical protein